MTLLEGWTRTAATGCTAPDCGTQDTVTLDGVHGRRCAEHPPTFNPTIAVELAVAGQLADAYGYCRTHLELPPCRVYSHGADGWHCSVEGPHEQHHNAAGDVTW